MVKESGSKSEFDELFERLAAEARTAEEAYLANVARIRHLPCEARAEAWLSYEAENVSEFCDVEAIVYFVSRGKPCDEQNDGLINWFRRCARAAKAQYTEPVLLHHIGEGELDNLRTTTLVPAKPMPLDVNNIHSLHLPNFWFGPDDNSLDATMLRAAEWVQIPGFDDWWHRLAREYTEQALDGDLSASSPISALLAVNFARSDFALELMPKLMQHYLALADVHHPAWRADSSNGQIESYLLVAAAIAFVALRTRGAPDPLARDACSELLRHQQESGAWPMQTSHPEPCVITTAYAVHALALSSVDCAGRAIRAAADWLKLEQKPSGAWLNRNVPVSVLVLDALALASGERKVTFGRTRPLVWEPAVGAYHPVIEVKRVHFEDFGGENFERIVFAFHLRTQNWKSLEWYGQVGSDLGRDIIGLDGTNSNLVCIQCVNRRQLTFEKAKRDLSKAVAAPSGIPQLFRFVCSSNVSSEMRDKIKSYAAKVAIDQCDVWSGTDFEERLRASTESLLQRFCRGVEFPDGVNELRALALSGR